MKFGYLGYYVVDLRILFTPFVLAGSSDNSLVGHMRKHSTSLMPGASRSPGFPLAFTYTFIYILVKGELLITAGHLGDFWFLLDIHYYPTVWEK